MAAIVLRFYLAVAVLAAEGHQVKVSDLYAMNFKAVADDEKQEHPVFQEDERR
jgi:putative NADPH-quinone reductase